MTVGDGQSFRKTVPPIMENENKEKEEMAEKLRNMFPRRNGNYLMVPRVIKREQKIYTIYTKRDEVVIFTSSLRYCISCSGGITYIYKYYPN